MSGTAETVAVTLAMSPRSAEHLTDLSVELCHREVVWAALADGRIDATKAQRIVDELHEVPDPRREHLELLAIEYATDHTPHQLRRYLLALTCDHDPDATLRKKALDNRGVSVTPRGHGMADINAYVSVEVAEAFIQALEDLAAKPDCPDPYLQGDHRTKDQRCADALAGFLTAHCTYQINVDVVIGADTLIGDNDYHAESKRLGPITSELARTLCFSPDARWRRLVTDPLTGRLVDMATPRPTASPNASATPSKPATSPAASPAATAAPNTPTATTSSPTPKAKPAPPTSPDSAATTTASRPTPPGKSHTTPTHPATT
jgi:hypothetical protein